MECNDEKVTTTVRNLVHEGLDILGSNARLDVEVLLSHVLGKSRSWLFAYPETFINDELVDLYRELLKKREYGEPLTYLLGEGEFWSLPLKVTSATLIPRRDTEILVEQALQFSPPDKVIEIADLGCGSGAVALAIAHERPLARVLATDICQIALAVARENATQLGLKNVNFMEGDWCTALAGKCYDIIVSNPPYITENDPHLLQGDLRFEPHRALVAGKDGLDALRSIIANAGNHLKTGGRLLLEHGFEQSAAVRTLLVAHGFVGGFTAVDLEQRDRVSGGQWQI